MGGKLTDGKKIDRKDATEILRKFIRQFQPGTKCEIAGSYRREKYILGALDVVMEDTPAVRRRLSSLWGFQKNGKVKRSGLFMEMQIDVNLATVENWGAMLLFATGSGKFNIHMRYLAKMNGMKLNQYGLWCGDYCIVAKTEHEIFAVLKLPYQIPEKRK